MGDLGDGEIGLQQQGLCLADAAADRVRGKRAAAGLFEYTGEIGRADSEFSGDFRHSELVVDMHIDIGANAFAETACFFESGSSEIWCASMTSSVMSRSAKNRD